jgi:hypothetical protein
MVAAGVIMEFAQKIDFLTVCKNRADMAHAAMPILSARAIDTPHE